MTYKKATHHTLPTGNLNQATQRGLIISSELWMDQISLNEQLGMSHIGPKFKYVNRGSWLREKGGRKIRKSKKLPEKCFVLDTGGFPENSFSQFAKISLCFLFSLMKGR